MIALHEHREVKVYHAEAVYVLPGPVPLIVTHSWCSSRPRKDNLSLFWISIFFFHLSQNLWKRGKMRNILFASVTFGDFKKFLKETIVDIISVYCLFCNVKLIITKKKWNSYHYENHHKYGLSFTFWPGAWTFLYDIWCLTWCNIPQECCNIWIHWNFYTL